MAEPTPPTEPVDKDVVWMHCRAHSDQQIDSKGTCQGNQAKVVYKKKIALQHGGGTVTRYRCLTCKGVWHIRM